MFRLTIDTDNDAFGHTTGQERAELGRTIRLVAALVEGGYRESEVRDYNGNSVGSWTLDAAPDEVREAAPEMLAALEALVYGPGDGFGHMSGEEIRQGRAAIAKAKGRTP